MCHLSVPSFISFCVLVPIILLFRDVIVFLLILCLVRFVCAYVQSSYYSRRYAHAIGSTMTQATCFVAV